MEKFIELAITFGTTFGVRILSALLILLIGFQVAKWVRSIVRSLMIKTKVDSTITSFVGNLSYIAFIAFVVVAALERVGVATTSFIAVLGAAGLAIGLALQNSLSNFASGFLLVLFRPFRVGDFISAGGAEGVVKQISFFTTTLFTVDNKKIIVPNSKIYGDTITNVTANDTLRVDFVFGIGYDDDIDQAKQIFREAIAADERILKDPAPTIAVSELADSSVNFTVRVWAATPEYWDVYYDMIEQVKKRLDAAGISIPYPQQEVYMRSNQQ